MIQVKESKNVRTSENREIRIFQDMNQNVWFVAQDVALAMGFKSTRDAYALIPLQYRDTAQIPRSGRGSHRYTVVDLRGVFSLAREGARLEEPQQRFLAWLLLNVLPDLWPLTGLMRSLQLGVIAAKLALEGIYTERFDAKVKELEDEYNQRCADFECRFEEDYSDERDTLIEAINDAEIAHEAHIERLFDSYEEECEYLSSELREAVARANEAEERLKAIAAFAKCEYAA